MVIDTGHVYSIVILDKTCAVHSQPPILTLFSTKLQKKYKISQWGNNFLTNFLKILDGTAYKVRSGFPIYLGDMFLYTHKKSDTTKLQAGFSSLKL